MGLRETFQIQTLTSTVHFWAQPQPLWGCSLHLSTETLYLSGCSLVATSWGPCSFRTSEGGARRSGCHMWGRQARGVWRAFLSSPLLLGVAVLPLCSLSSFPGIRKARWEKPGPNCPASIHPKNWCKLLLSSLMNKSLLDVKGKALLLKSLCLRVYLYLEYLQILCITHT